MKHQYSFKIGTPCSEKWNEMQVNAEGKFCSHCEKTVVNFMQMTENEIASFLHLNKGKKICGAIRSKQQTQKYHFIVPTLTASPIKRYAMAVLSGLLLTVPYQAKAIQLPLLKIENIVSANVQNPPKDSLGAKSISGKVIDKTTGKPIPFLSVEIDVERSLNVRSMTILDELYSQKAKLLRQKNEQNAKAIEKELSILDEKIESNESEVEDKLARWDLSRFKTRTNKDGYFAISLPEDIPELDLDILFYLPDNSVKLPTGQIKEGFYHNISTFYAYYKGGNQYEEMPVNRTIEEYLKQEIYEPLLGEMDIQLD